MNTHIILYAKGHYGSSGDTIADLRQLVGEWSGIDPQALSVRDLCHCVHSVWDELVLPHDRGQFLTELFFTSHHRRKTGGWSLEQIVPEGQATAEIAINLMLGGLVPVPRTDLPELEEKYDFDFTPKEEADTWDELIELCTQFVEKDPTYTYASSQTKAQAAYTLAMKRAERYGITPPRPADFVSEKDREQGALANIVGTRVAVDPDEPERRDHPPADNPLRDYDTDEDSVAFGQRWDD